jgi:catalase
MPASRSRAWRRAVLYKDDNDFVQAGALYRLMSEEEKKRLAGNIAGSLAQVTHDDIVSRAIGHFRSADPDYGARVEAAVKAARAK